ncbi:MAG: EVE domain-containing protein [Alphaproteobacteria bacterium CG_4_10_14_0_8_um_filter_37_21]|nr:MAG: EVE domain-containing protein [Alphaproteobacteria bacterium CG_4_10_14_0_8_um_filter_37_21]
MAFWLIKSEPATWSWAQQVEKGTEGWDGVRNYQAANNLKAMKRGDQCFFYHSNVGKEIVGIVEVAKEAYIDPTDPKARFVAVDVKTVKALKKRITLDAIKRTDTLQDIALIKQSRLSVMPISDNHWHEIIRLSSL